MGATVTPPKLSDDWKPRDERDARIEELEYEVERLRAEIEEQEGDTAADRARKYAARIDAALALHVEIEGVYKAKVCRECSGTYSIAYPCPTVKALKGGEE